MSSDIKQIAVGVTSYAFELPTYKRIVVYALIFSAFAGVVGYVLQRGIGSSAAAFVFGGADGIVLIAVPLLAAAALAATVTSRKMFRKGFRRFAFVGLVCGFIYGAALVATLAFASNGFASRFLEQASLILVANALVTVIWFIAGFVALNLGRKAFLLAVFHPLLNMAFLVIWQGYGVVAASIEVGSPWIGFVRMLFAALIMMLAVGALFFVINAPAKRNFGISSIQAATLFLAQWHSGEKGLEEVLAEMGETVQTYLGVASFKTRDGRQKAVFVAPYVHFGPMGNIGGSEFPFLLAREVEMHVGAPALVFHTTAYHDFNPVHSSSATQLVTEINGLVDSVKKFDDRAAFVSSCVDGSCVDGLTFGKNAFFTLSRAPSATDDIELSLGIALMNKAKSRGFNEVLLFDRHNSKAPGGAVEAGSKAFYAYDDAVGKLSPCEEKQLPFKMGVAQQPLFPEFTYSDGLGKAGIKAVAFETNGKRICFVLVDANNCVSVFRQKTVKAIKAVGFDYCDLMTTDTHAVNQNAVENPLGAKPSHQKILSLIEKTAKRALDDLEPCKAAFAMKRIDIDVLGARRSSELLSTVNSVVAVLKILAPTIFIVSLALAFATLLMVK
ncbi:TPA: DUF2070 family protein [Candidatus Micrarchaeota archaeon]|nr:DUF2070 family protein [Candidatus Micrarchaeota archaeon]